MASTLMSIKARMMLPQPELEDDDEFSEEDPRYELVQQLLAYQKYRVASEELEARRRAFAQRFPARPARVKRELDEDETPEPVEIELEDAHVFDLSEAYERIIASIDLTRLGDHTVEIDDTPIALYQEDLIDRLSRAPERRLTLQQAFEGQNIGQRIGMFLATLELVSRRCGPVPVPFLHRVAMELVPRWCSPVPVLLLRREAPSKFGASESHFCCER
jgi:segregation and condensation protein A